MTLDGANIIAWVNLEWGTPPILRIKVNLLAMESTGELWKTAVKRLLWLLRSIMKSENMTLMMSLR